MIIKHLTIALALIILTQTGNLMATDQSSCLDTSTILTPEQVAQAQLDAYNAKDIAAFTACYTEDVQVFSHPETLLFEGMDTFTKRYKERFKDDNLHAVVTSRMTVGDMVLDREIATISGVDVHVIAMYHVIRETGKIDKVWFIR